MIILIVVLVLVVAVLTYLFLRCGTFLEEGTGKLVLKFGAYHKTLIVKTGFTTDEEGKIVEGEERHLLGGWRWVGLWPIYKVFVKDKFRWAKIQSDGTVQEKEEENVKELLVRYYTYGLKLENAEDQNLVPTNSFWAVTAWTSNLKKAWLDTQDWFGTFKNRLLPYIRHHISLHTYQDIIADKETRLDKEVWETLDKEGIFKELEDLHGIKIVKIECKDISPDETYRKATLRKWEAERVAEERLGSTSGAVMRMIADQTGASLDEIRAEFKTDPGAALKRYQGLIKINKDFVEQLIASDSSSASALRRYYFQGGTGGMDLIALLGDVFRGGGTPGAKGMPAAAAAPPGGKGKKKRGTFEEDEEEEEIEEQIERDIEEAERAGEKGEGKK